MTFRRQHLPPFPQLVMDINLYRAYITAAAAERRSKGKIRVFFGIKIRIENGSDRSGYRGMITEAPAAPVYRAGIEAGCTADTFEAVPEIRFTEDSGTAVVHNNDMEFLAGLGFVKMTGIGGNRLPGGTAGQQPEKYG